MVKWTICFLFTVIYFWINWWWTLSWGVWNHHCTVFQYCATDTVKQELKLLKASKSLPCFTLLNCALIISAIFVFVAGILQHPDGTVLKQLQPPPRGPREMQFYSMVMLSHNHIQKGDMTIWTLVKYTMSHYFQFIWLHKSKNKYLSIYWL